MTWKSVVVAVFGLVSIVLIPFSTTWQGSGGPFGLTSRSSDLLSKFRSAVANVAASAQTVEATEEFLAQAGFSCGSSLLTQSSMTLLEARACLFVEQPPKPLLVHWLLSTMGKPTPSHWIVLLGDAASEKGAIAYVVHHDEVWFNPTPVSSYHFSMETAWCNFAEMAGSRFSCDWTHAGFTTPTEWRRPISNGRSLVR